MVIMSSRGKRIAHFLARLLFILALPGVLITGSLALIANNASFYESRFAKYNVSQSSGLAPAELHKTAAGIISYFNSSDEYIDLVVIKDGQPFVLFNERELMHLKDVRDLLWLDYKALGVTLGIVLAYAGFVLARRQQWRLWPGIFGGSVFTLVIMGLLGLGSLLNFDQLFLQFHIVSFTNLLWQLDPARDYMIRIFTQGFFYDYVLTTFGIAAAAALALGALSRVALRRHNKTIDHGKQSAIIT